MLGRGWKHEQWASGDVSVTGGEASSRPTPNPKVRGCLCQEEAGAARTNVQCEPAGEGQVDLPVSDQAFPKSLSS